MSKRLMLQLDDAPLEFEVRRVMVAGYTGRDTTQVQAHIAELERQGIPAPPDFPTAYPLDASYATTDTDVAIEPHTVSGEAEPALLFRGNALEDALVSVIVDFTDRDEERRSIPRSKLFPKPFSSRVWRYREVAHVWDEIALRSWVAPQQGGELYQSGKLAQLRSPADLLSRLSSELGSELQGTVLLMGTLPLLAKEFAFTDYFACEMETPTQSKLAYQCKLARSGKKGI
jgi:hypothetical protein